MFFVSLVYCYIEVVLKIRTRDNVIELGAGDALKTVHLLQEALYLRCRERHHPIDISASTVDFLNRTLSPLLRGLQVSGRTGEYFPMLEQIQADNHTRASKSVTVRFL